MIFKNINFKIQLSDLKTIGRISEKTLYSFDSFLPGISILQRLHKNRKAGHYSISKHHFVLCRIGGAFLRYRT